MNTLNTQFSDMTIEQMANRIEQAIVADQIAAHVGTLAFHGDTLVADAKSLAHQLMLKLMQRRSTHNKALDSAVKSGKLTGKAEKAFRTSNKYQGLNKFSQGLSRWLKGDSRHSGKRRVSIKSTGKTPAIALVGVSANSANNKPVTKPKVQTSKVSAVQKAKDLNAALAILVDAYGRQAVQTAAAKLI